MSENTLVALPNPPSVAEDIRALIGTVLPSPEALYQFLRNPPGYKKTSENTPLLDDQVRTFYNRIVSEVVDWEDDHDLYGYSVMRKLAWKIGLFDMFSGATQQSAGAFMTFTGTLVQDATLNTPEFRQWVAAQVDRHHDSMIPITADDLERGVVKTFGLMLTPNRDCLTLEYVDLSKITEGGADEWKPSRWIHPKWAKLIIETFYEEQNKVENKVQEITKPEVKYYTRQELNEYLIEVADPSDLLIVQRFIDDMVSQWSRHLALNTHKKQTLETPRFSLEGGPGIITVLLDRSDLGRGERAPQLQMIFNDGPNGLCITPRVNAGMTTSRTLDTYLQIVKELNTKQAVHFAELQQLMTFVGSQAQSVGIEHAFREAIGDPHTVLAEELKQEGTSLYFLMYRQYQNGLQTDQVVVNVVFESGKEGEQPVVVSQVVLKDVGQQGQIQFQLDITSSHEPTMGEAVTRLDQVAKRGDAAKVLEPVWKEVRATEADPDSVLAGTPTVPDAGENFDEIRPQTRERLASAIAATQVLEPFVIKTADQDLVKYMFARLEKNGNLSNQDLLALAATEAFIFSGGLSNLKKFTIEMVYTTSPQYQRDLGLREGNNAVVQVYPTLPNGGAQVAVVRFECAVNQK